MVNAFRGGNILQNAGEQRHNIISRDISNVELMTPKMTVLMGDYFINEMASERVHSIRHRLAVASWAVAFIGITPYAISLMSQISAKAITTRAHD